MAGGRGPLTLVSLLSYRPVPSNPAETGPFLIGIKLLLNVAKTLGTGP